MNSNNDLNIKKISKMLEMGGTMLAKHCDICGSPMFRYKGEEFCPICTTRTPLETRTSSENVGENQRFSRKHYSENSGSNKTEGFRTHTPKEYVYDEKAFVKNTTTAKKNKEHTKTEMPVMCNDANYAEKLIFEKIIRISQNMQQETEYVRILEQLKLIKRCVNIVKELKKLQ